MSDWLRKFQFVNWVSFRDILSDLYKAISDQWAGFGYFSWEQHSMGKNKILDYSIYLGFWEIRVWYKGKRPTEEAKPNSKGDE